MSATPRINETVLRNRLAELSEARDWQLDTLTALERFVRTADDYELFRC